MSPVGVREPLQSPVVLKYRVLSPYGRKGEFFKVRQSLVLYRISSPEAMEIKKGQMDLVGSTAKWIVFNRFSGNILEGPQRMKKESSGHFSPSGFSAKFSHSSASGRGRRSGFACSIATFEADWGQIPGTSGSKHHFPGTSIPVCSSLLP